MQGGLIDCFSVLMTLYGVTGPVNIRQVEISSNPD